MKVLDVNQHLSELNEHIKVLKSYGDVFEEVEARITRVINMEGAFKGEGAKGVIYNHAHMQLPTIRSIRAFLISFSETLEKMKTKINEYEPASNGSVSEDFWKNQLPKAYDRYEETLEERETAINQATAEVSHILHLGKLQTGDVYNSVDSARKHADTVLEGLYDLDQAGVELMAQVRTKMEELKATIRQVLDWTMTGGVTMKGVSIMEVGGYFANNATLHEKAPAVDTSKVSAGVHDPALADNPAYMISYQACSFDEWANPELREDYELIYEKENTSSASIGQEAGSAVLDFIPVVGNIKAGVEALTGKDLITGRELEDWERYLAAGSIVGGPIVKGASRGIRTVNNFSGAARGVQAYEVGTYNVLKNRSLPGDGLEIHHVTQKHPSNQVVNGYREYTGPSIVLPKAEHREIPTIRGAYTGTPRELLAKDVSDLRLYTNTPNQSIKELIELNKRMYPDAFKKK
ncbi:T7SS effector LXG polymorphic toxin [Halalkalibacterium halodurans]|uniref:T7SS effector LXG polymorphic toxin n=1 Tax=Halalkalibacterium halodurans TaxID=86665 RepID=UPI002AAA145D|nr:T7SS effector LXG polymorphic toxin [Halalkalibacterium halodurans]MDY7223745.1 T7SS effector LXG polymorphic toxin [Halalkalibacterium halodurans]MDY7242966.1 T7SS effector LXG polymorphic toxin [Halalkalibacterium halodurans]